MPLTEERLAFEGRVAGIGYYDIYDMTWGEILDFIQITNERDRRRNRDEGILLYQEMTLLSKMFSKNAKIGPVYEEFPYFTQEELDEIPKQRLRNYRKMMESYVKKSTKRGKETWQTQ